LERALGVLPLIAVLAFALFGMASLATDLGMAAAQQSRLEVAAEAGALAAFREEARLRYAAALAGPRSDANCDDPTTLEECVRSRAERRGRATAERVLAQLPTEGEPVDVDLGPSAAALRVERCALLAQSCWEVAADQAVPLLFGQGSMLSFQGSSLRDVRETSAAGSLLPPGAEPVAGALRERGVPIGSLSRVEGRRVVRVGPSRAGSGLPGRAPFAIDALSYGDSALWPLDGGPRAFALDGVEGRTLVDPEAGRQVGDPINPLSGPLPAGLSGLAFYVPLLSGDTVIGYGLARLRSSAGLEVVLERLPDTVTAPGNASASLRSLEGAQVARYRSAVDTLGESGVAALEALLVQAAVLR